MCTAVSYLTKDFYFGRTLDYMFSYGEEVVITPRNVPFSFRSKGTMQRHYAMIGMAHVADGVPLYYDVVNEKGLAMAGLNFVGNAAYHNAMPGKDNIASFELIPWIVGQCECVAQARTLLERINITNTQFNKKLPAAQLHWMLADRYAALTLEQTTQGVCIYDNPVGVLTNNPPFPLQLFQLNNYQGLSPKPPHNRFSDALDLRIYSQGMGALGLPGDLSSQSRFVRAAFTKLNARSGDQELESVSQFFHILGAVEQQRGCCDVGDGRFEITIYTSCCNADKGIYYYTTYDNHQITAVDLHHEDLQGRHPIRYPLRCTEQIYMQN